MVRRRLGSWMHGMQGPPVCEHTLMHANLDRKSDRWNSLAKYQRSSKGENTYRKRDPVCIKVFHIDNHQITETNDIRSLCATGREEDRWCEGIDRISGIMVSVLVNLGFDPRSGQAKNYTIEICFFSGTHSALRSKSKDKLYRNQNNVVEWNDTSTLGLLFQCWSSTKRT